MRREQVIGILRAQEAELRSTGVLSVSLFGSVARGEEPAADVDLAVRLGDDFSPRGLAYFDRLDQLRSRLADLLGAKVDVIEEPVRREQFQAAIDRDRSLAF